MTLPTQHSLAVRRARGATCRIALALGFAALSATTLAAIPLTDVATDLTDPANLADTEPSIAVNPANPSEIAIVSFSEGWSATLGAPIWKTADGGASWSKVRVIPPPATGSSGPADQKLAYGADGTLYAAELGFVGGGISDFVMRQTAAPPALLTAGAAYGDDQPHIDVDRSTGSPCANRVYSPWLNTTLALPRSMDSFSTDAGATETDVAAGDNSAFADRTTRIAVGPDGKAYIVYKTREGAVGTDFELAHFRVLRSDDCGATWTALGAGGVSVHGASAATTYFTNSFGNAAKGPVNRARSSDAWIAVGRLNNAIYVAYVNKDSSGFAQIYVAGSADLGKTWSVSRATDGTHNSAFPEIAVNDEGQVAVLYIDYDDSGPKTIFRHRLSVFGSIGTGWNDQSLQEMDPSTLSNASSGFIWGDYEGLTANGHTFYGVFTGASIGRAVSQLDPIFFKASFITLQHIPLEWLVDERRIRIPVPWPCLQCPPVPNLNIYVDGDPTLWQVRLQGPGAERVAQRQERTDTGVVLSIRPGRANLARLQLQFQRRETERKARRTEVTVRVEAGARPARAAVRPVSMGP